MISKIKWIGNLSRKKFMLHFLEMKERVVLIGLVVVFGVSIVLQVLRNTSFRESAPVAFNARASQAGIGVLMVTGPISFSSTSSFIPSNADLLLSQIEAFKQDKQVKGVLLRINSPGGTSGAAQEVYEALLDYKASTGKPVVASIQDVGASGAYYIAMAADTVFANAGSLVGSIGVFIGNVNIRDFAKKHGLDYTIYKSGPYKDTLSMWRDPSPEESAQLQGLVDNVHAQFLEAFIESRGMDRQAAKRLASGAIYTGDQALQNGLIDRLGTGQNAIAYLGKKVNLGENPTVIMKSKKTMFDFFQQWSDSFQFSFFERLEAQAQPAIQL